MTAPKFKTPTPCEMCTDLFLPRHGNQKYCDKCRKLRYRAGNYLNGMEPTALDTFFESETDRRQRLGRPDKFT